MGSYKEAETHVRAKEDFFLINSQVGNFEDESTY